LARKRNKKHVQKETIHINEIDSARAAAKRLLNLPKAKFKTSEIQSNTQAIDITPDSSGVTADDKEPDYTSGASYWKQKWEEDRIVGIQNQLEAQCVTDIARLGSDLRKEINDFKSDNTKWAIGIIFGSIIAIVLCLLIYHFSAVKLIESNVLSATSKAMNQLNQDFIEFKDKSSQDKKRITEKISDINSKVNIIIKTKTPNP